MPLHDHSLTAASRVRSAPEHTRRRWRYARAETGVNRAGGRGSSGSGDWSPRSYAKSRARSPIASARLCCVINHVRKFCIEILTISKIERCRRCRGCRGVGLSILSFSSFLLLLLLFFKEHRLGDRCSTPSTPSTPSTFLTQN
jgi:hypothetical protein